MKIENITLLRVDPEHSNVYSSFSHPGLALPVIGTVLRNAGYSVKVFVESVLPAKKEDLAKSDLVGFTVNSACWQESYRQADQIKRDLGCPVMFGGPHVTCLPEEALAHGDFVIRREGEQTVLELVKALKDGKTDFSHIAGLSWKGADGAFHNNPNRPVEENFDLIPDQSLIQGYWAFNHQWTQNVFPTGMVVSTSRGCPFLCTFCTIPQMYGNRMRYRSHDAVVADIRQQSEFSGRKYIYFADDNFTALKDPSKAFLKRIVDEKMDIHFSAEVRADATRDPEMMDLLRKAGCYLVFVGFESINDATLKAFKKGGQQTKAACEQAIREFHSRDIQVHGMFVLGADEDRSGAAAATAEWAIDQGLASIQILPICPLPGTEILQQFESEKRLYKRRDPQTGAEFLDYGAGNYVLYRPKQIEPLQLQDEILNAHRLFYSRANVARAAMRIPRDGINPFLFRALGRRILHHAEREVEAHKGWLRTVVPEGALAQQPQVGLQGVA